MFVIELTTPQLRLVEARLVRIERLLLRLVRECCVHRPRTLVLAQTLDGKEVTGMVNLKVGQYYRIAVIGELDASGNPIAGAVPQSPCTFVVADPTLAEIDLNAAVDANGNLTGQNDGLSCLVLANTAKAGASSVAIEDATGTLGADSDFTVAQAAAGLEIQESAPADISSLPAPVTATIPEPAAAAAAAPAAQASRVARGAAVPTGLK